MMINLVTIDFTLMPFAVNSHHFFFYCEMWSVYAYLRCMSRNDMVITVLYCEIWSVYVYLRYMNLECTTCISKPRMHDPWEPTPNSFSHVYSYIDTTGDILNCISM